jgi:hypothetical protein
VQPGRSLEEAWKKMDEIKVTHNRWFQARGDLKEVPRSFGKAGQGI